MARIFVTGIGTGVGKTIVSAIVTEALQADYWKPVQTGYIEGTDSETVRGLLTNKNSKIHPEAYCLKLPLSPHAAAKAEKVSICMKNIITPRTKNNLVIEGAGGLMVPLNNEELMIDYIKETKAKVILVVQHYLGSINHTLLSIEALKAKKIPVEGIIYNGVPNVLSEEAIKIFGSIKIIGQITKEKQVNRLTILKQAKRLRPILKAIR